MPRGGANFKDLTGMIFGRLTVVQDLGMFIKEGTTKRRHYCLCKCSCDKELEVIVSAQHLMSGHTKSCGCLQEERNQSGNPKHSLCHTRLYSIYYAMRKRCYKKSQPSYKDYGARGIKVCDEWMSDFQTFYNWAIENGYHDGLSIDRKDVDGDYCPENCKWSTRDEQADNKTTTIYLTYKNETKTLTQWAKDLNINRRALYHRYWKGWSTEKIIETPLKQRKETKKDERKDFV